MISRRSRCSFNRVGEAFDERLREIAVELARKIRIVRHLRCQQIRIQSELRVSQRHRKLRPRQPPRRAFAARRFSVLDGRFSTPRSRRFRLSSISIARCSKPISASATPFRKRQRQRLQIIVAQHEQADLVGHRGEQFIAPGLRKLSLAHGLAQRDLDVHFDVGSIDARRIVDRIGIQPHARACGLDPPALGHAEIGALADHLAAKLRCRDSDGIVRAIPDTVVGFGRRAYIGADAAEPQKIDRHPQNRIDRFRRRNVALGDAKQCLRFLGQRNAFRRARKYAAAFGNQLLVVVLPGGSRQLEQASSLRQRALRIRRGVDEDIAVIERGRELDRVLEQHAVAEYVARHIADAGDRERRMANIDIHFAEMPL